MSEKTSIKISLDVWRELNARKQSPSDTYDDVVMRLLEAESSDEQYIDA
jgi:macrodomain Ter protein organizer (MatP/YcbG family)